jgi:alpha-ribazole phosphatase
MITLLRHGKTEHNDGFYGSTDSKLTAKGLQTMHRACETLSIDAIVTSPLTRCRQFAQQLSEQRQCPMFVLPKIREYHFGDWEGMGIAQLWQSNPKELEALWTDINTFTPPNAETFQDFNTRLKQAIAGIKTWQEQYPSMLVVTHAGVIRALRLIAEQTTTNQWLNYPVDNASLHNFDLETHHITPICI